MLLLRIIFACVCISYCVPQLYGREPDTETTDRIVQQSQTFFKAPGVAVAVVSDDRVVYIKGFGKRDTSKPEPVTPDTLFPIASLTKAFTATAAASLVADGHLSWDTPIRQTFPAFRLREPSADHEVTLRDLLCHRTGLPRHDLIWRQPWSRLELMRRCASLPQSKPYRSEYQYNNLMYVCAGVVVGDAMNSSWEDVVFTRILQPAGMKTTNFLTQTSIASGNYATPYWLNAKQEIAPIPFRNLEAMCPAGGINSNVRDLSQWVRLQLGNGKLNGKQIIPESAFRETHKPNVIVPPLAVRSIPEEWNIQTSYAMGWNVADYCGIQTVYHGGSIDGFTSYILLAPREKLGIVVLNNLHRSSLPYAVAYQILDSVTNHTADWNARFQATKDKFDELREKEYAGIMATRKPDTKPSLALKEYAGVYDNPGYGRVTVSHADGKLRFEYAEESHSVEHFHYDVFRIPPSDREVWPGIYGDGLLTFRLNERGQIASVRFVEQEFTRIAGK